MSGLSDGGLGLGLVLLLAATLGPAAADDDATPCFDASDMEKRDGKPAPVPPAEIRSVRAAFEAAESYRACVSYASLFIGYAKGTLEFSRPDRIRWKVRHRPHRGELATLEVVRVGGDTWYRTGPAWQRLPSGKKLAEAVPGTWIPPEPAALVPAVLGDKPSLVRVGEVTARAGRGALWESRGEPSGLTATLGVGLSDHLPYRYYGGGPAIEAYLQLEIYDFGARIDIGPPQ